MRHLDDEQLGHLVTVAADVPGDEGESARDPSVRHLAECARCRRRLRDLRAIRHTLGALGAPAVPQNLAADIAARMHDAPLPDGGESGRRLRRRFASLGPRHLAIAATVAVAAGGISIAVTGGGSAASSTLPSLRVSEETGETPPAPAGQTPTPAAPARDTGNRVEVVETAAGLVLTTSANDYGHTTLGDGVNALFRTPITSASSGGPVAESAGFDVTALPTGVCLRAVGRLIDYSPATTWTLVGVELARYNGRPSTVLAFVTQDAEEAQLAVAVDGTCGAGDPLVLDQAIVRS